MHRHLDRRARYLCPHCGQTLCDLMVTEDDEGFTVHADGFCPGAVNKL